MEVENTLSLSKMFWRYVAFIFNNRFMKFFFFKFKIPKTMSSANLKILFAMTPPSPLIVVLPFTFYLSMKADH